MSSTFNLDEQYVDRDEFASMFNISVRTLERWHRLDIAPRRRKVGNRIFYKRSDIAKWMDTDPSLDA